MGKSAGEKECWGAKSNSHVEEPSFLEVLKNIIGSRSLKKYDKAY
jgi:hypothetical protein